MNLKYGITVRLGDDVKNIADKFPRAAVAVLNRGVARSQKLAVEKLNAEYNLPKSVIRKKIFVRKANIILMFATIRFSQRGINPYWFLKTKKPTVYREPVLLEVKRGSTMFPGNKFFVNIGRGSGLLKILRQPIGNPRDHLALMPFIKGGNIFKSNELIPLIKNFVEPYLKEELPRVIKAWYRAGRALE